MRRGKERERKGKERKEGKSRRVWENTGGEE